MRTRLAHLIPLFGTGLLLLVLGACGGKSKSNEEGESTKFHVYYVQGEKLFKDNCSNCHHEDGTGLGLVYPPVNKSDFVDNHFEEVICMMRHGRQGEIIVNGQSYIQGMPPLANLSDIEIAEIATYLYNHWGRNKGLVDVRDATRILEKCPDSSLK